MSKSTLNHKGLLPKTAFVMAKAKSSQNFQSSASLPEAELFFRSMQDLEAALRASLSSEKPLVMGDGSLTADLVFIGETLSAEEETQSRPFVGPSGTLLEKMIEAMGLKRADVYLTTVIKHRLPDDRTPNPEEVEMALPYLRAQLKLLNPKIVVALGSTAAHSLLGTLAPLQDLRGKLHPVLGGAMLIATHHPSFLVQYPASKKEAWEDLKLAMKELGLKGRS
jgi:uracil-DNA glycosylase family 4